MTDVELDEGEEIVARWIVGLFIIVPLALLIGIAYGAIVYTDIYIYIGIRLLRTIAAFLVVALVPYIVGTAALKLTEGPDDD